MPESEQTTQNTAEKTKVQEKAKALEREKVLATLLPPYKSSLLEQGAILKVLPDGKDLLNADENTLDKTVPITRDKEKDPMTVDLHLHRLTLLRDMLENAKDYKTLRDRAKERKELISKTFAENMALIYREQRPLEKTWCELAEFYNQARLSPDDTNLDVYIINASFKNNYTELMDPETGLPHIIPTRASLDMDGMVGLIVIPEWLESEARIVEVAKIAQQGMAHVFIGFKDCSLPDAWKPFEEGEELYNLKSHDREKQHVSLVGNHFRVRKANRYEDSSDDGLYISPVLTQAGMIYKGDELEGIHVAQANKKVTLATSDNSEPKLRWKIENRDRDFRTFNGKVIPLAYVKGIRFWGVDNLFDPSGNSEEIPFGQYTVKRCDEYISRVVLDFLQGAVFSPNDVHKLGEIRDKLQKFLDKNTGGPEMMLQKGLVVSVAPVPGADDEVDVVIEVKYKTAIRFFKLHFKYDAEQKFMET